MIRPTRLRRIRTLTCQMTDFLQLGMSGCEVTGCVNDKFPTCGCSYIQKGSYLQQNIFTNPYEFVGLCWVLFRSHNVSDAKRKEHIGIHNTEIFSELSLREWDLNTGIWKNGIGTPPSGPPVY